MLSDVNEITVVLGIVGVTLVLFIWNRLPVEMVAVGASLALLASGVIDIHQALDGFGDPTVVFIATLFVVSTALDATGVTAWAGRRLNALAGHSPRRLLVFTMLFAAGLTAIISVNGAVAALLPTVVVAAVRRRQSTSQLLLPLAFAAHAGSQLALTGAPVNVLVSEAAYEAGVGYFGYFEFALVGVPLLIGTIVVAVVLGPRLLPRRSPASLPPDPSAHAWDDVDREVEADRDPTAAHQPSAVRPPAVPLGRKAIEALLVTAGMVVLLASGRVPAAVAGLLAVGALLLLEVLTVPQAYRGISWTTVVLVAGLIPVATAMQVSGAAGEVAEVLADIVGGGGPSLLLFVIFVICVVFGAVISNIAVALIVIPVALSAAAELDVSPKPVLLAVSVSCAAALLIRASTAGNRMVMKAGAYTLRDYPRFGLPILALYGVLVVFYIPLIWSP